MTPDHSAFADWDAAYVLGALTPADRRAYEAHLEECERCRAAIAELASMPGLLARATLSGVGDGPGRSPATELPENLVELVAARDRRRRSGVRLRIVTGLATAAAVVGIAVAVPLVLTRSPAPAETVALAPVDDSPITATVGLSPVAWGTRIAMECDYPSGAWDDDTAEPWAYSLVVTEQDGATSQVSTWNAVPGRTIRFDAATAAALGDIASIEIRSVANGRTLLAVDLG